MNRNKANTNREEGKSFHVKLRQNQMFGPWGPGAIIPCPDGSSLMLAGLDAFPYTEMEKVFDRRLAKYVGVSKLLAPPLDREMVPAVRFPHWMYCPHCKTMKYVKNTQRVNPRCDRPSCEKKPYLIPDRFIVACPDGHIDDLPILEWVHGGTVADPAAHTIKRITTGERSSLGDVVYKCVECNKSRSLARITRKGELAESGYRCRGSQPWLDIPYGQCKCDPESVVVIQRGGTNVWYSDVVSSIYVPETKNKEILDFVERHIEKLNKYAKRGDEDLDEYIEDSLVEKSTFSSKQIKDAYLELTRRSEGNSSQTEMDYREVEYKVIKEAPPSVQQKGTFVAKVVSPEDYSSEFIREIISSVSLVTTLKETKALVGFTRLFPRGENEKSMADRKSILSRNPLDWTLGIQMTGEGIFVSFNRFALEAWISTPAAKKRFAIMQSNFDRANQEQGVEPKVLNPFYVLIHTLSHLLMLELSKECGYTAASVKERIYCDKYIEPNNEHREMLGLLIYTASDDSEGSLGGLVRAGRPDRFDKIFENALYSACWCSFDPVCIESRGQGQSSCNLAACFSCALVPETSCESGNKLLDRALIVGTLEDSSCGLFGEKLKCIRKQSTNDDGIEYFADLASGQNVEEESFREACEYALFDASDDERLFLEELMDFGDDNDVEKPIPDVEFKDSSEKTATATLTWPNRKVALLFSEQLIEFEEAFGEQCLFSSNWRIVAFRDLSSVEEFFTLIKG